MAANFMTFLSFSFVCFLSLSSILTLMNIIRPVHTIYNIIVTFRFFPTLLSCCKRLLCALQQDITANDPSVDNLIGYVTFNLLIPSFFFVHSILSFGAPAANKYKIIVDGREPMLFETSQVLCRLFTIDLDKGLVSRYFQSSFVACTAYVKLFLYGHPGNRAAVVGSWSVWVGSGVKRYSESIN